MTNYEKALHRQETLKIVRKVCGGAKVIPLALIIQRLRGEV